MTFLNVARVVSNSYIAKIPFDFPASAPAVVEQQACSTGRVCEDATQGFAHAGQTIYQLNYTLTLEPWFLKGQSPGL